jgi:hypothetical protein
MKHVKRQIVILDRGESLKNRVYRQVVKEIEEAYVEGFPLLKKGFCAMNGVTLL